MKKLLAALSLLLALAGLSAAWAEEESITENQAQGETFSESEVVQAAERFFGQGAEGLAEILSKAFKDHGRPNAYIAGEEGGGAIGFGLRYGQGNLVRKNGETRFVYWQGPSIGLDVGGNAAKTFILVYSLPEDTDRIYSRYPGVDGSLYYVAGVGMNVVQNDTTTLVPIRFGVGWRQGASVGYLKVTRDKTWNPF